MGFNDPGQPSLTADTLIYEHNGSADSPVLDISEYRYVHTTLLLTSPNEIVPGGKFTLEWEWRRDKKVASSLPFFNPDDAYFGEYQDVHGFGPATRFDNVRRVVFPYLTLKGKWKDAAGLPETPRPFVVLLWGTNTPPSNKHFATWRTVDGSTNADGNLAYFDVNTVIGNNDFFLPPYVGRAQIQMLRIVSGTATEINGLTSPRNDPAVINERWLGLGGGGPIIYPSQYVHLGPQTNRLSIVMSVAGRVIGSIREAPE